MMPHGLAAREASLLLWSRGPLTGVLWANTAYDHTVGRAVYQGCHESEKQNIPLNVVVYKFVDRQLHSSIMDNCMEEGPRRWVAFATRAVHLAGR